MKSTQPKRIAISLVAAMGIAMASQAAVAHGNVDDNTGMDSGMMDQQQGQGKMSGMNPGMMNGMGQGMMGGNNIADIDDESRAKINTQMDSLRLKSWEITGLALKEAPVLRDALSKELPDPAAVGAIYANLFDLKQQLIEAQWSTRNAIKGIVKNAAETETESKE